MVRAWGGDEAFGRGGLVLFLFAGTHAMMHGRALARHVFSVSDTYIWPLTLVYAQHTHPAALGTSGVSKGMCGRVLHHPVVRRCCSRVASHSLVELEPSLTRSFTQAARLTTFYSHAARARIGCVLYFFAGRSDRWMPHVAGVFPGMTREEGRKRVCSIHTCTYKIYLGCV